MCLEPTFGRLSSQGLSWHLWATKQGSELAWSSLASHGLCVLLQSIKVSCFLLLKCLLNKNCDLDKRTPKSLVKVLFLSLWH